MVQIHWPPTYDRSYVPEPGSEYWNSQAETMAPAEREALILGNLGHQVRYAYENSAFYREFWGDAGTDPSNIKSLDDFRQLPILTKDHLRQEQEAHPPFGRYLCVPRERVMRIHGTSGTTGNPTLFGIGEDDWDRIAEAHARILWSAGLRPDDMVIVTSVFSAYIGSWGALLGAERLGAMCFPFGAGAPEQTERAVDWIGYVKPTALYGTPSYALYLAATARRMGIDPRKDFNIRLMFFSGEPGASIPSTRKEIEETFGCHVVDMGSMAEMTPWMTNSGCRHLKRGMHLWNDIVYAEMLDPDTKAPTPPGTEGVPVYTHLERTSQPMIRYWSGDLARWDIEPCACGRTYPTLPDGLSGRVDDMIIVRGQSIFPSKIEDILRSMPEFGGEFRLIVDREQGRMDSLTVQVEVVSEVYPGKSNGSEDSTLAERRFADELRRAIGVGLKVELKPEGEFERTQFKARRIIDKRSY